MKGRCVLGYKLLLCAFFDGKTTLPIDFSLHSEKGKEGDYGLTDKQRKARYSKKRDRMQPDYERAKEASRSKLDVAIVYQIRWNIEVLNKEARHILDSEATKAETSTAR